MQLEALQTKVAGGSFSDGLLFRFSPTGGLFGDMFLLVLLEDIVRIPPEEFEKEEDAIAFQVNQKFANKVIEDLGLCIELYDVLEISQGTVYAGDGAAFATVKFRMIVFKPFVGELLVGSVKSMDHNGVVITLDFFDQVLIPPSYLQRESEWNGSNWYWRFGEHRLWMNIGDQVRVRVEAVVFNPPESKRLAMAERKAILSGVQEKEPEEGKNSRATNAKSRSELDTSLEDIPPLQIRPDDPNKIFKGRPMYLIVSANESGLGLTAWWLESQAQEEGAEDDENQLPNEEQEEDLTHLDTSADGDGVGLKSESSGTIKP